MGRQSEKHHFSSVWLGYELDAGQRDTRLWRPAWSTHRIQDTLRIASVDRNYCWSGTGPDGKGAQIDLLLESKADRTDYLCEMKFTGGKYAITKTDEENFLNKTEAFAASKMHNKTHSIQLVMVTTMGIARGEHASIVNLSITLDDMFVER